MFKNSNVVDNLARSNHTSSRFISVDKTIFTNTCI